MDRNYMKLLDALIAALEAREHETREHSQRVSSYTRLLAEKLKVSNYDKLVMEKGALLHDIGKIGISDRILLKPGPLTDEEWDEMRQHPRIGYNILKDIPFLESVREIVLTHHEHVDGSGYPRGLKGPEIPLGSAVFCVVDAFDAMVHARPYRQPMSYEEARQEIRRKRGTQFFSEVADAFLDIPLSQLKRIEKETNENKKNLENNISNLLFQSA